MNQRKFALELEKVIENQLLIEIERQPIDNDKLYGFVLESDEFVTLLQLFDPDLLEINGYSVIWNKHVSSYKIYSEKQEYLESNYIQLKNIQPQPPLQVSIQSMLPDIVRSINENFKVFSVYREEFHTALFNVGSLEKIRELTFRLLEIEPNGKWKTMSSLFKFADITRIDFGRRYENALYFVAEENKKSREI